MCLKYCSSLLVWGQTVLSTVGEKPRKGLPPGPPPVRFLTGLLDPLAFFQLVRFVVVWQRNSVAVFITEDAPRVSHVGHGQLLIRQEGHQTGSTCKRWRRDRECEGGPLGGATEPTKGRKSFDFFGKNTITCKITDCDGRLLSLSSCDLCHQANQPSRLFPCRALRIVLILSSSFLPLFYPPVRAPNLRPIVCDPNSCRERTDLLVFAICSQREEKLNRGESGPSWGGGEQDGQTTRIQTHVKWWCYSESLWISLKGSNLHDGFGWQRQMTTEFNDTIWLQTTS